MSAINGVSRSWGREGAQNKRGLELQRNSLWLRQVIKSEVAGTLEINWKTLHCILALLLHPFPRHLLGHYRLQDTKWIFDPT